MALKLLLKYPELAKVSDDTSELLFGDDLSQRVKDIEEKIKTRRSLKRPGHSVDNTHPVPSKKAG